MYGIVNIPGATDLQAFQKSNVSCDKWELLPCDIIMGHLLGEGAFGEVYEGCLGERNSKIIHGYKNVNVAIKILKGIH